jgi:NAD(P)-dependent dehydrogenase (short-subunit alcohol dehydrogenase family)
LLQDDAAFRVDAKERYVAKIWLITGISRGLGHAIARAALDAGDTVVGTTRSGDTPDGLSGDLRVLPFEAADPAAADRLVADAFAVHGRIDFLVNNAGYGLLGPVEETDDQAVHDLFEVNVFAPFRVIRAALPRFRAQESGHIVNIASIAGVAPAPGSALYGATKAALSAMSYGLAAEVAAIGVWVTVVSPGAFRTDFLADRSLKRTGSSDAYAPVNDAMKAWRANDGRQDGDPALAAAAILQLVDADEPPLDLLLGQDALDRAGHRADRMAADVRDWRSISAGTGHPSTTEKDTANG